MRDIKFRGKRLDNGEWVYGFLIQYENGWFICNFIGDAYQYEVYPSTVGQHIGVRDKNGTDVFDGDLIQDANGKLYRIIWGNDLMWLAVTNEKHGNCYSPKVLIRRGAVVIGNIHENPELMQS